jgi:membrane protein
MKAKLSHLWQLTKQTASEWSEDNATRLAAALAFYTVLSIAPLLVLAIAIIGLVFGEDAARGQVASELAGVVGPQAGEGIQTVIQHANSPSGGIIGSIVSVVVLLFGASGVFGELQSALNTIWDVKPKPGLGIKGFLRARLFSFTMVLSVAFLLLVSLVLSAGLSAVGAFFEHKLPGGEVLWSALNFVISLGVITCLFAMIFKTVPDVQIGWRDVWIGAALTALLFTIGKFLLGLYLGRASVASPYGAAGSIIVLVIWVYYATQILFMGAEFTQVYARSRGAQVIPSKHAMPADEPTATAKPASRTA